MLHQRHGKPRFSSWCWRSRGRRKNGGEAADSPAEPKDEAGEGRLYDGGEGEDSHADQDDTVAEVLDSLVGL